MDRTHPSAEDERGSQAGGPAPEGKTLTLLRTVCNLKFVKCFRNFPFLSGRGQPKPRARGDCASGLAFCALRKERGEADGGGGKGPRGCGQRQRSRRSRWLRPARNVPVKGRRLPGWTRKQNRTPATTRLRRAPRRTDASPPRRKRTSGRRCWRKDMSTRPEVARVLDADAPQLGFRAVKPGADRPHASPGQPVTEAGE